jgi:hypothetical protein
MKLQKILVPVDFSRCSETAFRYAKLMATKFSARINMIHVVDKRYVEKLAELNSESEDEVSKKLCLQAKKNLERFSAGNDSEKLVAEKVVTVGTPFQTIALVDMAGWETARSTRSSLVVRLRGWCVFSPARFCVCHKKMSVLRICRNNTMRWIVS